MSLIIFFMSMAIILFIFVPKILSYRKELQMKGMRRTFVSFGAGFAPRSKELFSNERDVLESHPIIENVEEEKCEIYNPQHESHQKS